MKSKSKKPWPTKAVMQQIYERNFWGTNGDDFYSGEGSHKNYITVLYIDKVEEFLRSFSKPISVLDLGCGDFNIGKQLVEFTKNYIAVDIVPELINFNKEKFKIPHLEFQCLDISQDDLPIADCVLLRQVLQHLSNKEIAEILEKLTDYKYIILTEHLPKGNFIPNLDMIADRGNRTQKNSGVVITAPPFNFKARAEEFLVTTVLKNDEGIILTTLYTL